MGSAERRYNDLVSRAATGDGWLRPILSWMARIVVMAAMCLAVQTPAHAAIPNSVSITSSVNTVVSGERFQLMVSVTASPGSGSPTGTITLYDGTKQLGVFDIVETSDASTQMLLTVTPQLAAPYTMAL